MSDEDWGEVKKLLVTEPYRRQQPMVTTMRDHIIAEGQRQTIQSQLEKRFGPLSETAQQRLEKWPRDKLRELGLALLTAQSLKELGLED